MIISNATVFVENKELKKIDINVENGVICGIGNFGQGLDLNDKIISPGLIDIHSHGRDGSDYGDGKTEAVKTILKSQLRQGVTSVLATTMTQTADKIFDMISAINEGKDCGGAQVLGINLEGPFVSPLACGAQDPRLVRNPDITLFNEFQKKSGGTVKLITLAPEYAGAAEFIKKCDAKVSLGHSKGTRDDFFRAINAGAVSVTHLFNAMTPLHHREPGIVGAALVSDCFAEIICDMVHVDADAIRLALKAKGADKMIMISDSMSGAGLADGIYELGGQRVFVNGGIAKIENGALAGSTSSLSKNVRLMIKNGFAPQDVLKMCTGTPAALLENKQKGVITPGRDADFTVFNNDFSLFAVIKAGNFIKL